MIHPIASKYNSELTELDGRRVEVRVCACVSERGGEGE